MPFLLEGLNPSAYVRLVAEGSCRPLTCGRHLNACTKDGRGWEERSQTSTRKQNSGKAAVSCQSMGLYKLLTGHRCPASGEVWLLEAQLESPIFDHLHQEMLACLTPYLLFWYFNLHSFRWLLRYPKSVFRAQYRKFQGQQAAFFATGTEYNQIFLSCHHCLLITVLSTLQFASKFSCSCYQVGFVLITQL